MKKNYKKVKFDFVVIGGGSAGYAAARTASDLGLSCAVIDYADRLGGLCILRGCMPSKALIESANRFLTLRHAREWGLRAKDISANTDEIYARKNRLIDDFASYRQKQLLAGKFSLYRAKAVFINQKSLHLEALASLPESQKSKMPDILEFETCLVASGSKNSMLPASVECDKNVDLWTSDDALYNDKIPTSICVLGGGAIALEMAHFFEGIGVQTSIVQRHIHFLRNHDAKAANVIGDAFRKRGMAVHTGTKLLSISKNTKSALNETRFLDKDGKQKTISSAVVLSALGRSPNADELNLAKIGVKLGRKGEIVVNANMQTNLPHIFAAGDVVALQEVVHVAIEQGEKAARNAKRILRDEKNMEKMDYRLQLFCAFCQPEYAAVGLSEDEAKRQGIDCASASYPFDDHGKSMCRGEIEGFVKIICRKSDGEIIGACVVGAEASELIHEITIAMHFHANTSQLATIPHYHPTLSEIWTYPAEELAKYA